MLWKEFLKYHKNAPMTIERFQNIQQDYQNYKIFLKQHNKSIENDLYEKYFSWHNFDIVIADNKYPYKYEQELNATHKLVWIRPGKLLNISENDVEQYLKNKLGLIYPNIVLFENIESNKSVLHMRHFHLFVLKPFVPLIAQQANLVYQI